jgi:hypothetical protein
VSHSSLDSVFYLAYFAAGAVCLAATAAILVRIALARVRGRVPARIAGQEVIWTLVPVLALVGLTVASKIPHGWGAASNGGIGATERGAIERAVSR